MESTEEKIKQIKESIQDKKNMNISKDDALDMLEHELDELFNSVRERKYAWKELTGNE